MPTPHQILHDIFGYSHFRGQQAVIIDELIQGRDALVLMPTGGGKSLCYQIPALIRAGVGIVISPLIALMQNQVSALLQLGIKAACLNSNLDNRTQYQIEQQLLRGELDLLYVSPERLVTTTFLELLEQCHLALFAIDEAHCVSQWGHDFRPEYMQLSILQQKFPSVPRIALTATADAVTQREIRQHLGLHRAREFKASFDRPNIRYTIEQKHNVRQQLLNFIETNHHRNNAGIIYCLSRKKVDAITAWIQQQGFRALSYHAGLDATTRHNHQKQFLEEETMIMVATIAFGMGIDKSNVRFVAHLDLPRNMECYYQETGRAGRDGLPADAWMTYGLSDVVMLRRLFEKSEASLEHKRMDSRKLTALLGFCETIGCRRQALMHYFNENDTTACGNCDNCLNPVTSWDGTIAAQMALSCIYRTGQRFGAKHVIDVLLGNESLQISRFRHDKVSTYGIGKNYSASQWESIFRQLAAAGYISTDMTYGSLRLTEPSRALLRGEQSIAFRHDPPAKPKKNKTHTKSILKTTETPLAIDQALLQKLKDLRLTIARNQGVPPYIIFHDSTLNEMSAQRPQTLKELAEITGVGQYKLEHYGQSFLEVLQSTE